MLTAAIVMTIISTIVTFVFLATYKPGDNLDTPKYTAMWVINWMLTISTCILWGLIRWYCAIIAFVWLEFIIIVIFSSVVNDTRRRPPGLKGRPPGPEDFGLEKKKVDYLRVKKF
jgi:hypothetical protein